MFWSTFITESDILMISFTSGVTVTYALEMWRYLSKAKYLLNAHACAQTHMCTNFAVFNDSFNAEG